MTTCIFTFFLALLISILLTRVTIEVGARLGITDNPDDFRKIHVNEVPLLGGAGIFVAFFIPVILLLFYKNLVTAQLSNYHKILAGLGLGSLISFGMGLYDDIWEIRARWKLLFQIVAALIAYNAGLIIEQIDLPFIGTIKMGYLSFPFTIFWFLGCMNAVNLLDGLDGLAAGVCLVASITMMLVCLVFNNTLCLTLACSFSGAVLGFLVFNFYPARIFLGDSGSMFLGFMIGAFSILGSRTTETGMTVSLLIPLIALALPILDTSLAILRRLWHKLPVSTPDRRHIHHALLSMGFSQRRTVLILYTLCILFGISALLVAFDKREVTLIVFGSLAIIVFVCTRILVGLRFEDVRLRLSEILHTGRHDTNARIALDKARHRFSSATTMEDLWKICEEVWKSMDINFASLTLREGLTEKGEWFWTNSENNEKEKPIEYKRDRWTANFCLLDTDKEFLGNLEIIKTVHQTRILQSVPEIIDHLRTLLGKHIYRINIENFSIEKDERSHK